VSSALIGVLGVLAGSVASVGAQSWLALRARRTDAIASARIVYSALADMSATLMAAEQTGTWGAGGPELFHGYFATWEEHRVALARAMSALEFHEVQVAFINMRQIANARTAGIEKGQADQGVRMLLDDQFHEARVDSINRARVLAFKAGERWSDKAKRRLPGYQPTVVDILAAKIGQD
jgi:hypothetical protein